MNTAPENTATRLARATTAEFNRGTRLESAWFGSATGSTEVATAFATRCLRQWYGVDVAMTATVVAVKSASRGGVMVRVEYRL